MTRITWELISNAPELVPVEGTMEFGPHTWEIQPCPKFRHHRWTFRFGADEPGSVDVTCGCRGCDNAMADLLVNETFTFEMPDLELHFRLERYPSGDFDTFWWLEPWKGKP